MNFYRLAFSAALFSSVCMGCASHNSDKPGIKSQPMSRQTTAVKSCTLVFNGKEVLRLTVASDADCASRDNWMRINGQYRHMDLWLLPGAKSLDDAVKQIPQVLAPEFKDFQSTGAMNLTVAANPARQLQRTGFEADDGDAGAANVIMFQTGNHYLIAAVHGEDLAPENTKWMETVVHTAQTP